MADIACYQIALLATQPMQVWGQVGRAQASGKHICNALDTLMLVRDVKEMMVLAVKQELHQHKLVGAYLMCIMGWGFLLVWALEPQLGQAAMGTPCSLLLMLRPIGMSRDGLASKKPKGLRKKPTCSAGMTGQSSIRGMCVTPKECHRTQSASTRLRSCVSNECPVMPS